MSKEMMKQHFAELCECIWDRIENQDKLDGKAAFAMRKIVAQFAMLAWNMSIQHKSYAEFRKSLTQFAEQNYEGNPRAMQPLMDAAELKWHDYRDDREPIASVDVKQVDGKPRAVAYFKDERPDSAENGFLAFLQFMESPENQERLKNTPPEKREEEKSRIADEYFAMHPGAADVEDDDDDSKFGDSFEYPMSYEELENLYEHTLRGVEKESKLEILKELLEYQPFLVPLCKDAEDRFEKSEKIYEKEQKTGETAKYPGSVPELILTLLTAFTDDTDLEPYDDKLFKEYLRDGKKLVKALLEDEFDNEIRFEPEQNMLHFIVDRVRELGLPEKEFKKQLGILLAWGLILGDTREDQHDDEDAGGDAEEYDFDEDDLHALQLHVELCGYRCSADVLVREDTTFEDLHNFLNPLFEREDDHLYRFECDDGCTCVRTEEEIEDEDDVVRAANCYLGHHLTKGSEVNYIFDYGDDWEHDITVKKVVPIDSKEKYPKIIKISGKIPEQYPDYDEDAGEDE